MTLENPRSANPMVEVLRSKVFYARAHTMIVVPTFFPLPATGVVRLLLAKVGWGGVPASWHLGDHSWAEPQA